MNPRVPYACRISCQVAPVLIPRPLRPRVTGRLLTKRPDISPPAAQRNLVRGVVRSNCSAIGWSPAGSRDSSNALISRSQADSPSGPSDGRSSRAAITTATACLHSTPIGQLQCVAMTFVAWATSASRMMTVRYGVGRLPRTSATTMRESLAVERSPTRPLRAYAAPRSYVASPNRRRRASSVHSSAQPSVTVARLTADGRNNEDHNVSRSGPEGELAVDLPVLVVDGHD